MEIVKGVHQLKLPMPDSTPDHVNVYLVKTGKGCLLVDSGWIADEAFATLEAQLNAAGVTFDDLVYVVITHVHSDHYGLAGRVAQRCHATLLAHQIEAESLDLRFIRYDDQVAMIGEWLRANGAPERELPALQNVPIGRLDPELVVAPDQAVTGGEHLKLDDFDFQIIWTPGHSPGHICLYEERRGLLFCGDHVLPEITPNISICDARPANPLGDYFGSLRAVAGLSVDISLPAHGEPFRGLGRRVEEIRGHAEERQREVLAALDGQYRTAYEISGTLTWNTKGVPWMDLPPVHKRVSVFETLAHLEHLHAGGHAQRKTLSGVVRYASPRA